MPDTGSGKAGSGLFETLRRLSASLVEVVRTRVELVAVEVEEQRLRATRIAVTVFLTLFFASLGLIFGTLAVVVAYWERDPVAVLGGFAALYLLLALAAAWAWRAQARVRPRLLAGTLAELARDRDELQPPS